MCEGGELKRRRVGQVRAGHDTVSARRAASVSALQWRRCVHAGADRHQIRAAAIRMGPPSHRSHSDPICMGPPSHNVRGPPPPPCPPPRSQPPLWQVASAKVANNWVKAQWEDEHRRGMGQGNGQRQQSLHLVAGSLLPLLPTLHQVMKSAVSRGRWVACVGWGGWVGQEPGGGAEVAKDRAQRFAASAAAYARSPQVLGCSLHC